MACYTLTTVSIDDTELNRRARKKLGLAETGDLSWSDARRVKTEAALLKAEDTVRRADRTALVRRVKNPNGTEKLSVTVQR